MEIKTFRLLEAMAEKCFLSSVVPRVRVEQRYDTFRVSYGPTEITIVPFEDGWAGVWRKSRAVVVEVGPYQTFEEVINGLTEKAP